MSFSDQQGCPQIFNIRPIDLHSVFSVFSLTKPSKSRLFYALSRQAILHAANDLPMPNAHPTSPQQLEDGGIFSYRNGGKSLGEFGIPQEQLPGRSWIPKKGTVFFFWCRNQRNPTGGRCDRWDFFNGICAIIFLAKHKHWRFMTSAQARFTKFSVKKMGFATGFMTHL